MCRIGVPKLAHTGKSIADKKHTAGMACLLEHNAALCDHNTVVYHVNKQYLSGTHYCIVGSYYCGVTHEQTVPFQADTQVVIINMHAADDMCTTISYW